MDNILPCSFFVRRPSFPFLLSGPVGRGREIGSLPLLRYGHGRNPAAESGGRGLVSALLVVRMFSVPLLPP